MPPLESAYRSALATVPACRLTDAWVCTTNFGAFVVPEVVNMFDGVPGSE